GRRSTSATAPGSPFSAPEKRRTRRASMTLRSSPAYPLAACPFLFTGDITAGGESALVRSGMDLSTTVLKVAHHGSSTSTSPAFVARASPLVDVISVGADNAYGHPTDEVLARLAGDLVLRTDQHGDITIST